MTENTLTIANTRDWQVYKEYSLDTQALTAGIWTLELTFLSSKGQYTGNLEDLSIEMKEVVDGITPVLFGQEKTGAIYSIDGRYVGDDEDRLERGIYIRNGRKIFK